MRKLLLLLTTLFLVGCGTSYEVEPGYKGMANHTGWGPWAEGNGLDEETMYENGTYYLDMGYEMRLVDCQDRNMNIPLDVVASKGTLVQVSVYVVFRADCSTPKSMANLIKDVPEGTSWGNVQLVSGIVEPEEVWVRYVEADVKSAVRSAFGDIPLLDLNAKREQLSSNALALLNKKVSGSPIEIKNFNISTINLPEEIQARLKQIETKRLEQQSEIAEQQRLLERYTREKETEKARIEKERFSTEQNLELRKYQASKEHEVAKIEGETQLLKERNETALFEERAKQKLQEQRQWTPQRLEVLRIEKDAEVRKAEAEALSKANLTIIGGGGTIKPNFVVPNLVQQVK